MLRKASRMAPITTPDRLSFFVLTFLFAREQGVRFIVQPLPTVNAMSTVAEDPLHFLLPRYHLRALLSLGSRQVVLRRIAATPSAIACGLWRTGLCETIVIEHVGPVHLCRAPALLHQCGAGAIPHGLWLDRRWLGPEVW